MEQLMLPRRCTLPFKTSPTFPPHVNATIDELVWLFVDQTNDCTYFNFFFCIYRCIYFSLLMFMFKAEIKTKNAGNFEIDLIYLSVSNLFWAVNYVWWHLRRFIIECVSNRISGLAVFYLLWCCLSPWCFPQNQSFFPLNYYQWSHSCLTQFTYEFFKTLSTSQQAEKVIVTPVLGFLFLSRYFVVVLVLSAHVAVVIHSFYQKYESLIFIQI